MELLQQLQAVHWRTNVRYFDTTLSSKVALAHLPTF